MRVAFKERYLQNNRASCTFVQCLVYRRTFIARLPYDLGVYATESIAYRFRDDRRLRSEWSEIMPLDAPK